MAPIEADAARNRIRVVSRFSTGVTTASPYLTPAGELVPLLAMIRRVTEAFYPGIPFGPVPTFGGSTTSIHFRQKGIAAYGYSPVPANITDSVRRHGNDERIFLRDYVDGVELYKELLLEFAFESDKNLHATKAKNDRFRRARSGVTFVSH
jgi:acetylornithine deacetylase/succinyl-diaminopimelate desuccinylase-like protein